MTHCTRKTDSNKPIVKYAKEVAVIILTDDQRKLLSKYIPDFEKFDYINDLLDVLDDVMLNSLDDDDEATDETVIIAKLYDQIYSQN